MSTVAPRFGVSGSQVGLPASQDQRLDQVGGLHDVETRAAVEVGDRVVLGATRGCVVRLFDCGFAVQFARLLPFERFDARFRP